MKKIGCFILLFISLLQFLICPLEANAEMNVNSNNSTIETISINDIIVDSSSTVDDTSYIYNNHNDRCPPTGGEKRDKINDILLALVLLIVLTVIAIISKFISDENHRDDDK